jgi:pimeloyl-ACP methyl ester carboxylesterase
MKKILYLHGLESSNIGDKVDFLKENAIVIAPAIDYSKPSLEEELLYIVEKFSPDLIIGSSMGGFVGMMIANRYNIECILFNPAIHSRPMEPNLKLLQYDDIKHIFNPIVILGMEDDVINPLISKEMLDDALSYCNIMEVEDLGHRVPLDVFVDIYNKYAI